MEIGKTTISSSSPIKNCFAQCLFTKLTHARSCIYTRSLQKFVEQSAKINELGCRDGMHYAKNHGNKKIPLVILSRITPPYIIQAKG